MAHKIHTDSIMAQDEAPANVGSEASASPAIPARPTLTDAFYVLCGALEDALEDNLAEQLHANEIQAWMQNGGTNGPIAWKHAIILLEHALGHALVDR